MRLSSPIARLLIALSLAASPAYAEDSDALYKQGLAYKQEGKTDEAIKKLEAAVAANPRHGMAWSSLGNLYKQKQDMPKAVKAYEMATAVIKKDKNLWENLGITYYRNKQLDQALSALKTASQIDPKDAQIRSNLGTVKRQKGDIPGAIPAWGGAPKRKASIMWPNRASTSARE